MMTKDPAQPLAAHPPARARATWMILPLGNQGSLPAVLALSRAVLFQLRLGIADGSLVEKSSDR